MTLSRLHQEQIYHYNCVMSGSTTIYGYIFVFIDAKMIENWL